jgi:hypothetical protein
MRRYRVLIALTALASLALPASALGASDNEILLARPLAPTDLGLLQNHIYPGGGPMTPAPGNGPSEAQASGMLDAYEKVEFPNDAAKRAQAMAVFNDATAKSKIPSPSLRAALAALTGTIAESAIGYVLHHTEPSTAQTVSSVRFGSTPNTHAIAMFIGHEIIFNQRYKGENPFTFVRIMAHEPLHGGEATSSNSNYEEAVNSSLDDLVYLKQIAHHPGVARLGTELARVNNINGMWRLNGGLGSRLGLFSTNVNRPIFPGSPTDHSTSWWEDADNGDTTTTPGNPILPRYLARIHSGGTPTCSGTTNSKTLLDCIDKQENAGLSSAELVKAAKAMKLDTNVERRRTLSISYGHSNFTGKLTSSQKPCTRSQSVAVYRQRSGPDQKVGSDRTNSSGAYSVHKSSAKGTFYAKAARSTVAGTGVCLEAKSRGKRVS